jgi:hypothetical protein
MEIHSTLAFDEEEIKLQWEYHEVTVMHIHWVDSFTGRQDITT